MGRDGGEAAAGQAAAVHRPLQLQLPAPSLEAFAAFYTSESLIKCL